MTVTAAFVVFAMTWFMVFFVVLPLRVQSQAEKGDVLQGTPAGAPAGFVVKRKARLATFIAIPLWALICAVILSGVISVRDFDLTRFMGVEEPHQ